MKNHERLCALAAVLIVLALTQVGFSEIIGNITIESINNSAATGLWGATVTTTSSTTTTINSGSESSDSSITGTNTTTTSSTTTTSMTTTTVANASRYDHYVSDYNMTNYSESYISGQLARDVPLKNKLSTLFGSVDSGVDIKGSSSLSKNVAITRTLDVFNNMSRLEIRMFYNGSENLKNFMIYSNIPKAFAIDAKDITVTSSMNYTIVESDPSFLFTSNEIKPFTALSIKYTVNRTVDMKIINNTESMLLVGYAKSGEFPFWIVWIFVAVVIVAAVIIFRNEILSAIGVGKKYSYGSDAKKKDTLKNIIDSIKDILRGRKKEVRVVYNYEKK